jgi:hypothetical protein
METEKKELVTEAQQRVLLNALLGQGRCGIGGDDKCVEKCIEFILANRNLSPGFLDEFADTLKELVKAVVDHSKITIDEVMAKVIEPR